MDINNSSFIEQVRNAAALYSASNSVQAARLLSEGASDSGVIAAQNASSLIQELLLKGQADTIKKIALIASVLYKKSTGETVDVESCVSVVDNVVELINSAYQVGTGQIDANTAAGLLVDRLESRAVVFLDNAIDKGMPVAVDAICTYLSKVYPPFTFAVPYVKYIALNLQPAVTNAVRKGIHALSAAAKPFIAKAISSGQRVVVGAAEKLRRLMIA